MKRQIEVELKFEIIELKSLHSFLSTLQIKDRRQVVDQYIDTPKRELFQRGIFIRVRDGKKVDFKFNKEDLYSAESGAHEHCDELSFQLPLEEQKLPAFNDVCSLLKLKSLSAPDFNVFLKSNFLDAFVTIDKLRVSYVDDEFNYMVDTVKELGSFFEIDTIVANLDDVEMQKSKMRDKVKEIKLAPVETGYVELYLRQYDFDTYKKGKYLLHKDN